MSCNGCGYSHPMEPCDLPYSHEHEARDTGTCRFCYDLFRETLPSHATLKEAIEFFFSPEGRTLLRSLDPEDTFLDFELPAWSRDGGKTSFRLSRRTRG